MKRENTEIATSMESHNERTQHKIIVRRMKESETMVKNFSVLQIVAVSSRASFLFRAIKKKPTGSPMRSGIIDFIDTRRNLSLMAWKNFIFRECL
jgi:hypothetical protein